MADPRFVFKYLRCAIWCLGRRPVLPGVGGHLLVFHGDTVEASGPSWGPAHKAQGILGSAAPDFPLLSAAHPLSSARTLGHKGAHSLHPLRGAQRAGECVTPGSMRIPPLCSKTSWREVVQAQRGLRPHHWAGWGLRRLGQPLSDFPALRVLRT